MKKVYLMAVIVFGFTAVVKAGDIEALKGIGFGGFNLTDKMAETEVALPDAVKEEFADELVVSSDTVDKFSRVEDALRRLRHDTTWLDNDMRSLERDARRIASSGKPNPFFVHNLRRLSTSIKRYADNSRKILADVRKLLKIAVKSDKLNKISKDMERDAISLYHDSQFRLENATRDLERAVRMVKPEVIGHNAQWMVFDITKNVRDYSRRVSDIHYGVQNLVDKTKP